MPKQSTLAKKPVSSLGIKADGKYKLEVFLTKPVTYFKKLFGLAIVLPN